MIDGVRDVDAAEAIALLRVVDGHVSVIAVNMDGPPEHRQKPVDEVIGILRTYGRAELAQRLPEALAFLGEHRLVVQFPFGFLVFFEVLPAPPPGFTRGGA